VATKVAKNAVGPYLDQAFVGALAKEMPWLIEGDARFAKARR
jgi:hypothetical protein